MGDLKCVLVFLVVLQITIKSTSAFITKEDVSKCINGTKFILLNQQNSTRTKFDELKLRKINDSKEHQDKKVASLDIFILKETGVLSTFKESAVKDGYDVSACKAPSAIYDQIKKAFNENAKEYAAEFKAELSRNYTRNLFLVNQFALNYQQAENALQKCGKNETACFEKVQDKCEKISIQDDMENLETKFSVASEAIYGRFRSKIDKLYQDKNTEVSNYSQNLKDCYKTGDKTNTGFSIHPMHVLTVLPIVFSMFA